MASDPGPHPPRLDPATGGDADRSWLFDLITGLLLTGFCALPIVDDPVKAGLSIALTGPWVIRRRYPLVALTIATSAALVQVATIGGPVLAIVAVPLLVYSFARWASRKLARAAILAGLAGSLIGPARWMLLSPASPGGMVFSLGGALITALACAGMVSVGYVAGSRRREKLERQRQTVQEAMERQRLLLAEQQQRARAAAVDERNRIARELHDIVAHSLSVIVVQAEGGRAQAANKPEKGPEVLATVAETSRDALEEMRRMVGLLRSGNPVGDNSDGNGDDYLPTPGLNDLAELVDKTGDQVALHHTGEQPDVGQALGLTAYRIVQESLTNFLKYAGPQAHAEVVIGYQPAGIELTITDDGASTTQDGTDTGHGLRGMQERVAMHQGRISAGPRATGGFKVHAWLPLSPVGDQHAWSQPPAAPPEHGGADNPYHRRSGRPAHSDRTTATLGEPEVASKP